MVGTIEIRGSNGEVMAPFGSGGAFIKGRRRNIHVVKIGPDKDTPSLIREALVGMTISCIFTKEQIGEKFQEVPDGSCLAYTSDVVEALRAAEKEETAVALENICPNNKMDMYVFEPGIFELLD